MAGAKRPLSEADGNVSGPPPSSKRQAAKSYAGRENDAALYTTLTKGELCQLLRSRHLKISGTKAELVQRLEQHDSNTHTAESSTHVPEHTDAVQGASEERLEFWTICRPLDDITVEKRATYEDYESSEDDEGEGEQMQRLAQTCGTKQCICKKPSNAHPQHRWLLSREGYKTLAHMRYEEAIRNEDNYAEYHFSDFNGYGFQEMMENQLLSFNKEISKKQPSVAALWSLIEGFAFDLPDEMYFHIDDPDHVLATLKLVGGAVFCTLRILKERSLLRPNSSVKNIALVLALLRRNHSEWPSGEEEPELAWCDAAIREAQRSGIEFKGAPFRIQATLREAVHFLFKRSGARSIGGRSYVLETPKDRAAAKANYTFW
ncbi:hypothetical protein A1O3_01693 [Capronia epimyces CBS 606.96]|uniref:SAP domain-containing protein n=1 Tax=Capronia epimyces CBS 606.96 TaxID=1182542 RepID=W9YV42_9EURO|nr:uncharacterized protein A1O3_01693 [Capronia epimyces CBS 606.96]EXJ93136.1 hypothetical protein A1O3_01693 [Capronia epimyces CBS 606.96]